MQPKAPARKPEPLSFEKIQREINPRIKGKKNKKEWRQFYDAENTLSIARDFLKVIIIGLKTWKRPPGFRPSAPPEYCPRCKEIVSRYDLLSAPEGANDKKWCFRCINDHFDEQE